MTRVDRSCTWLEITGLVAATGHFAANATRRQKRRGLGNLLEAARFSLLVSCIAFSLPASANCPIGGDGVQAPDAHGAHPPARGEPPSRTELPSNASRSPTRYEFVGELNDGTYILHAVARRGGGSQLHEILAMRPTSSADLSSDALAHAVVLGGESFVIEKFESVPVDHPCSGDVSIHENTVQFTIAAP